MPSPDPIVFAGDVEEIARGAGAILMRHFRNLAGVTHKGSIDLVTVADKESEEYVAREIARRFPDHALLGEEGGRQGNPNADYLWIVDPLDGTTNFAHGLRLFGVSIAIVREGRPLVGAVYAPALEEMYLATRGHGATRNGERLYTSSRARLIESLVVTGFPYNRGALVQPLMQMLGAVLSETRGVLRLGAASLDFAWVASGHIDAFYEYGLKPWDMAAGVLLVEEAGGRVTNFEGDDLDLFHGRTISSNGHIHEEVRRLIREGAKGLPGGG